MSAVSCCSPRAVEHAFRYGATLLAVQCRQPGETSELVAVVMAEATESEDE